MISGFRRPTGQEKEGRRSKKKALTGAKRRSHPIDFEIEVHPSHRPLAMPRPGHSDLLLLLAALVVLLGAVGVAGRCSRCGRVGAKSDRTENTPSALLTAPYRLSATLLYSLFLLLLLRLLSCLLFFSSLTFFILFPFCSSSSAFGVVAKSCCLLSCGVEGRKEGRKDLARNS